MPRKKSETVLEGKVPIPQNTYVLPELPRRTSDEFRGKCGRKFVRKVDSESQENPRR